MNTKHQLPLLGLLTILWIAWLLLYFIPDVLLSLFHTLLDTLLGNLLLVVLTLLAYTKHPYLGIATGVLCIILYRAVQLSKSKDGFTQTSVQDFLGIQETIHPHKVFDMNVIATQATQDELDYFNKYALWPWSIPTIDLYKESLRKNPYVRNNEQAAIQYARSIYNEEAIKRVLYNQSEEGRILIHGLYVRDPRGNPYEELPSGFGTFPYESGLQEDRTYDRIRCSMKNKEHPTLERTTFIGKDGIFGSQLEKNTPVDYTRLETILPGFKFKDKPCNPCKALQPVPDYSCKFSIRTSP
jgi:hypothetical protein